MFKIGDLAVYPAHGVGRIESIESREISGEKQDFYIMKILDNNMIIMIPVRNVDSVGLRDVIDKKEVPRVYEIMKKRDIPADALVLPGHNLPFVGLHARIDELAAHHEVRCLAIAQACRQAPCTAADLVPVVFRRAIDDPHQMGFAFSEVLAHVNYMLREHRLQSVPGSSQLTA